MVAIIDKLIVWGVVIMQLASLLLLFALIQAKVNKVGNAITRLAGKHSILIGFLVLLASVVGSLFYSNVLGYDPCVLCWYQRIFIYPQLVIFGLALWKRRTDIWLYSLGLSLIGILVALYHNFLPYFEKFGLGCGSTGPSCSKLYVFAFGYLTIPVMSLSVFFVLILLAISYKYKDL
ncbi:MAG TPA: disulfide bond formation protein B [Candidatus Paceibacterota bacterium]